jgi:hypothetical protein
MDKWHFFQDSRGLWRWRRTTPDDLRVVNSVEAFQVRAHAVADAITHGYLEAAENTVVTRALPETAQAGNDSRDRMPRDSRPSRKPWSPRG